MTPREAARFERLWDAEENAWRMDTQIFAAQRTAQEAHDETRSIVRAIQSELGDEYDKKLMEFHAIKDAEDALAQARMVLSTD